MFAIEDDKSWMYACQTPLGFGKHDVGDVIDPDLIPTVAYVLYMDDCIEVCTVINCERGVKCDACKKRLECLSMPERELEKFPYHEPLNECPEEPEHDEPYGCTMWCRGALYSGAYTFPV